MAHIEIPANAPGIIGLMMFRPETAVPLNALAEALLREPNSLSRGERELIAATVSRLNDCHFCCTSHSTFAALQLDGGWDLVDSVLSDPATPSVSPKLRALLGIAVKVQQSGKSVTETDIDAARIAGASDVEIHDAVLIAAAFCMFNRYVDGLGTWAPENRSDYLETGQQIVSSGYVGSVPTT